MANETLQWNTLRIVFSLAAAHAEGRTPTRRTARMHVKDPWPGQTRDAACGAASRHPSLPQSLIDTRDPIGCEPAVRQGQVGPGGRVVTAEKTQLRNDEHARMQ